MLTNIYLLLDQVEKRKAMFLGNDYNFQSLSAFVAGYQFAAGEDLLKTKDYNDFSYFNTWILGYLDVRESSFGWYYHLNRRNPDNDENAFKEFFEFLERFKIDTPIETRLKVKSSNKEGEFELKKLKFKSSKTIWVESVNSDVYSYNSWFFHEEEFLKEMKKNFEIIEG